MQSIWHGNEVDMKIIGNNKGSALLYVIICISLISILCTMIISATMLNSEMKYTEQKSASNFYTTEDAVNEFSAALEQQAQEVLKVAYSNLLQNYATENDTVRKENFYTTFATQLKSNLDTLSSGDAAGFKKLFTNTKVQAFSVGTIDIITSGDVKTVRINDVKITYLDAQLYSTTIQTNMDIDVEYPDLGVEASDVDFSKYIIINDGNLEADNVSSGGSMNGNIYSAAGINFKNWGNTSPVTINSSKIITNGNLLLSSSAAAEINIVNTYDTLDTTGVTNAIWARNIDVTSSDLTVNGNSYIADDLSIQAGSSATAPKSNVTFTSGKYCGYGYTTSTSTASASSAIVLNTNNFGLDLGGLSNLLLAGDTYISDSSSGTLFEALQGESIGYKPLQKAYLVPGECITGIGHNPILPTDITALPSGTTIVDYINGLVDLSKNTSNGLNLSAYVGTQQCIIDVVTRNGASSMIYVYLNFKSKEAAAQYLKDMSNDTDGSEVVTKAIKGLGSITLPASMETVGNVVTSSNVLSANSSSSSTASQCLKLARQYNSLLLKLTTTSMSNAVYTPTSSMFSYLVNESALPASTITATMTDSGKSYRLIVGKGDIALNTSGSTGIIISGGNVTVSADFKGVIIAKGNVNFTASASLTAAPEAVDTMKENLIFKNDGDGSEVSLASYLWSCGSASDLGTDYNSVDAVTITYSDWVKNP